MGARRSGEVDDEPVSLRRAVVYWLLMAAFGWSFVLVGVALWSTLAAVPFS